VSEAFRVSLNCWPTGEKLINKKQLFSNSIGDLVEAGRRVVVAWLIAIS